MFWLQFPSIISRKKKKKKLPSKHYWNQLRNARIIVVVWGSIDSEESPEINKQVPIVQRKGGYVTAMNR